MHDIHSSTDDYAARFAGPVGEFFNEVEIGAALELLQPWQGATVLDVGGGHARLAVPMVKQGYHVTVTGSDESCRRRLDRFLPAGSFEFVPCASCDLPYPSGSFDVVVSTRLLAHEERWQTLLGEMCRVARKAILFDYPPVSSANCAIGLLFNLKLKVEKTSRTFRVFRQKELMSELERIGYSRSSSCRQFLLPMALHRMVGSAAFSRRTESLFRAWGLTSLFGSPELMLATPVSTTP